MKNINVDTLLKNAMNSREMPSSKLVDKVKYIQYKDRFVSKKITIKHSFRIIATSIMVFMLIPTTAFAAWYLLKSSEVADQFEDFSLSAALESQSIININDSVTSGEYTFTLLAMVSGRDITDYPTTSDGEIRHDRTYIVTAIQKVDGSAMTTYSEFYVSPYVKGFQPWQFNTFLLNGGCSEAIVDGIRYQITEVDEITMFADRGLYIGINTGWSHTPEAFIFDELTGELRANPNFDGSSAVFKLPIDKNFIDTE